MCESGGDTSVGGSNHLGGDTETTSHCREAQDARTAPSWAAVLGAACHLGKFPRLDPMSHQEQCGNQRMVTSLRLHH